MLQSAIFRENSDSLRDRLPLYGLSKISVEHPPPINERTIKCEMQVRAVISASTR